MYKNIHIHVCVCVRVYYSLYNLNSARWFPEVVLTKLDYC